MTDALRRASYTVDGVRALVGDAAIGALGRGQPVATRRALEGDRSPLATLVRLFLVGDPVSERHLADALPVDDAMPLLVGEGSSWWAGFDVAPHRDGTSDWWVVSDRTDDAGRPLRPDHVLGIGGASTTLAQLTVRRPVGRALDVGTGCGVQALHLSGHSHTVTATDSVPRALALAATSFALSDVAVGLGLGDLVEPVRDEQFDLVVCNPPFVVGPTARFAYRDAGGGDELSQRAVRAAASVLADGGVAQLLVNWVHVRGEDWHDRASAWVTGLGCDAWLVERDVQEPVDYVATWLSDAGEGGDVEAADRWLQWFQDQAVEAVGFGWVVLRRCAGPHRIAVEHAGQAVEQPLGPAVGEWLDRVAWLRERSDAALLDHAFRAAGAIRLETTALRGDEGWQVASRTLASAEGFRWTLPCDEATAAIVAACDGQRPLAAIAALLAAVRPERDADVVDAVCVAVRGLVDRGVLLP